MPSLFLFTFGIIGILILAAENTVYSWNLSNNGRHYCHQRQRTSSSASTLPFYFSLNMNMLTDAGDFLTGGKLTAVTEPLVYGEPLGGEDSMSSSSDDGVRTFAVQERAISFTGEDFDICDLDNNGESYCRVRGAMMHLPGKDKMRIVTSSSSQDAATLDRKLMAITPTYDILRGRDGDKIGWLEKAVIAFTDTFEFHAEITKKDGFLGQKPAPAYKLEGDFLDRRFVMKNNKGEVVAKITKDRLIEFDAFDHYQIRVSKGMDIILVVACACAIDEEFDEEHKKKREEENR